MAVGLNNVQKLGDDEPLGGARASAEDDFDDDYEDDDDMLGSVSYTHLDVYKRQALRTAG